MIKTMEHYLTLEKQADTFRFWQEELLLRQKAHTLPLDGHIPLQTEDSCDFMYRCLYFSDRRFDFFSLLFANLHDLTVLKWLNTHPSHIMEEFLHFLAWKLSVQPVKPEQILFLINIFRSELQEAFVSVFHVLNLEQCRYLMARTANPQFRELLKRREEQVTAFEGPLSFLLEEGQLSRPHMTLHGDKGQLLQKAARSIDQATRGHYVDPAGPQRFTAMLEACDLVFQCGLVEDALFMLAGLYRRYQEKNRLVDILEDRRIFKSFSRLARILVPVYSLLQSPRDTLTHANMIWERHFNLLARDPGSLYYLALYESIVQGLQGHGERILWEVLYKSQLISQCRIQDRGPLFEKDILESPGPGRIQEWVDLARERLVSLPHESFTLLELLRLLHLRGMIASDQLPAQIMLEMYLDLWAWMPSSLFVNPVQMDQLAPLVDATLRRQAQRLIDTMEQYRDDRLKLELQSRPDLFRQKDGTVQREILLGHVLGVLT
ncbi:MAG TPA: hypothetical protein VN426_09725 [Syntrophomonadaceae bacterium]|nr:hypothetical protein [Syntrophomonadaceae bacterium]